VGEIADATGGSVRVVARGEVALVGALAGQEPFSWVYFGSSVVGHHETQAAFVDKGSEIAAGPLLNEVADEFRDELLNFDHVVTVRDELRWQATDLAERSIFTSRFLQHCCSALALRRILDHHLEDLVVVVEDAELGRGLLGVARAGGRVAEPVGSHPASIARIRLRFPPLFRGLVHRLLFLRGIVRTRRAIARHRSRPRFDAAVDTVLVTWVDPGTFDPSRQIDASTFFGDLPAALRARGRRVGYVASLTSWVHPLETLVEAVTSARDSVVVVEETVSVWNAISLVLRSLRMPARLAGRLQIGGVDLTGLVASQLWKDWAGQRHLWALQFRSVGRFLCEAATPFQVIHLFENQPWEKTMRLGLKEFLPGAAVIGCQHTPVSERWFPYFPSRRDVTSGQLPDTVFVIGPLWERQFLAHGYPPDRLQVAPPLRYRPQARVERIETRGEKTVFVAGSIGRDDSVELVSKALLAFEPLEQVDVTVKLHPWSGGGVESFRSAVEHVVGGELARRLRFVSDPIAAILPNVDLVLYNTTSVSYEALAVGIPVVFVESDFWFDADPIPAGRGPEHSARTPEEIRALALPLLDSRSEAASRHRQLGYELVGEAFSPGTAATFAALLDERLAQG
jgi:hypothetical protein